MQHSFLPGEALVVRVAGFPLESLQPLRYTQTIQLIHEIFDIESRLHAQSEALSEALYSTIGEVQDKQLRHQLVALRRTIFQVQKPKNISAGLWTVFSSELAERIRAWLSLMQQRQDLLASGQELLETEWTEKRRELQRIAQLEFFQQGLVLGSKDLYADLTRWLKMGLAGSPPRDRQLELGLFTYLSRMTTKTSPYSTFMSTARGNWVEDGPVLTCSSQWQRHSAIELNWSIAQRIAREIARWPEIRPSLALRLNSSLREDRAYVSFSGWQKRETIMHVENSPIMQHILRIIRGAENLSYAAVVQTLTLADPQGKVEESQQLLEQLIKIGLLELSFGIPDQSRDYVGQLLDHLQPFREPRVEAMILLLQHVQDCLQQYGGTESAAERHDLREKIADTLGAAYQVAGLQESGTQIPEKDIFYESSLLEADIRCARTGWENVLSSLELLRQLSVLYDAHMPGRIAAAAFFSDHYGAGANVSLLQFYEDFSQEQKQPGGWRSGYRVSGSHLAQLLKNRPVPSSVNLAEPGQVYRLQEEFYQRFIQPLMVSTQEGHLDEEALRRFVAGFPAFLSPSRSLAFYVQLLIRDGRPQLVLNAMNRGFGRGEGQLRFLENQVYPLVSVPHVSANQPEAEPLWTDIAGVFGTNTSLHIAQTPYELGYPGVVSGRPQSEQLALSDLEVVHDPRSNALRLRSRRLQQELLPVHLGLIDDSMQPPLYRFLIHLFGEGGVYPRLPLIEIPQTEESGAMLPLQSYPRLSLGDVVIERASWLVGTRQLPRAEKGTSVFEHLLKVQRWRAEHNLPQECFVRVPAASTKDRKPLYIDFSNYLSVMLFEQMVQRVEQTLPLAASVLFLQEMLPGSEDLVLHSEQGTYVSEFVVELTHQPEKRTMSI